MTPPSGECSYRQLGMQAGVLDLAEELKALAPLLDGNGHFSRSLPADEESTSTAVILEEGGRIRIVDYRGPTPQAQLVGRTWPVSEATIYQELVRRRTPINLGDLWASTISGPGSGSL